MRILSNLKEILKNKNKNPTVSFLILLDFLLIFLEKGGIEFDSKY